ncbi:glycoside hydrolase family 95 protein [Streptomyces sp. N2-109]|uniref:Glycoside hydrolase family 95 protein n=1 Tax=Streptomyces gossypii TaxID=2883101 RepID=A0ABT2JLT8_9ACTN|nr:glycoside hydrolase family 95 protein [Streptomyces gossypii]MCT2588855.1 glycoside hydrolase family 95 protein [Streptomyces gossypii]
MTQHISRRTTMKTALGVTGGLALGAQPAAAADTATSSDTATAAGELTLWYTRPAADWERESLPLGGGALGASVYGTLASERLVFNEKTLWTGGPGAAGGYDHGDWSSPRPGALASVQRRLETDGSLSPESVAGELGQPKRGYGAYQVFGDLVLDVPAAPTAPDPSYRRGLDLATAVATVAYTHQGTAHQREFFASHPGRVLAGRFRADQPGSVGFTLRYTSPRKDFTATASGSRLTVRGALQDNGLRFEAQIEVRTAGGSVTARTDGTLTVRGADSAWFVLAAGTDYADTYPDYRGDDPHAAVTRAVNDAARRPYEELRAEHESDHRALFDRVSLDIGQQLPDLPTDQLLAQYTGGSSAADRALEALFFQYGRYLLIASSRAGSLPANLQGVWNNSTGPAWSADYHVNINLQMNYWPAEVTNLAETTAPYARFVETLCAPGRRTARKMFGSKGWVVHNETNPYGFTGVHDWPTAFWFPEAAAWITGQLYEHYRFSGSLGYLRATAYPVMKEAAEFWLDNLRPDPRDGKLVATPSYSPEHGDFTAGAAMSQQIVHDLLTSTLEAARTLGEPPGFRTRLEDALDALDPGLRVGSWGQLQEWKADLDSQEDEHRHVSHLFALHPGRQIAAGDRWAEAARVSLTARGDGGTGWSKAWKINFWARLHDGDHSHTMLAEQLRASTLPNLWDTHPPYQIDGNFGATAGIAEMLVQSQHGPIEILPALPGAWPRGEVRGLRARGGVTLDITWSGGRASRIALTASRTGELTLRSTLLPGGETTLRATAGERYLFT